MSGISQLQGGTSHVHVENGGVILPKLLHALKVRRARAVLPFLVISFGGTMSSQAAGTEDEREWHRVRELQQAVSLHLMEMGPTKWEALYHIDQDRSDEVAHALRYLARGMHIAVGANGTVSITTSGMRQIKTEK